MTSNRTLVEGSMEQVTFDLSQKRGRISLGGNADGRAYVYAAAFVSLSEQGEAAADETG